MADKISSSRRSENMRRIRSKDTSPELAVRKLVHKLGFRYRLHVRDMPGRPDLVFPRRRAVIFVHGCFWHMHSCEDGRLPKTRREYWVPKLSGNVSRHKRAERWLRRNGWRVMTIWDCETKSCETLSRRLLRFLNKCGQGQRGRGSVSQVRI
jgi:DNA mismatch endonuclease (patch repair protein)